MNRTLLLLTLTCIVRGIWAQSTYSKFYDGGTSFKFNLVEMPIGGLLVGLGRTRAISHLDDSGNITYTHSYWAHPLGSMTGLGGIRQKGVDRYAVVGGYRIPMDTCSSLGGPQTLYHPTILSISPDGSVLDHRYYMVDHGCRNILGDLIVTADGGIVAWGHDKDMLVMKVDSELEPLWARRFPNNGGFQFIKELPGGDLLAGINVDTAGAVVARMDANGNFLWCKSYVRPRGMVHDAVIESDDSFVITGYTDSTSSTNPFIPYPPSFHPRLFMMKLDGQGTVQWCKGYDSAPDLWYTRSASHIVKSQDGKYCVIATMGFPNNLFWYRPLMLRADVNGDTLWTRSVGATGYTYNVYDLIAHSDGGYIFSGEVLGDLPNNTSGGPFIYKTDSLGHLSCHEYSHGIEIMDLFPSDSSIVLTSTDGLTVQPAFMNDTTFAPISAYDACVITEVQRHTSRYPKKPLLRPNPNTGRFTVQFHDPLLAESYYSVFDTMGKLLMQRRLPTGATLEEVDLSRFGRGTYVLKFTSPEGVCHERVVVE